MSSISKDFLRDYINEQKFTSPTEVLSALKSMFKDSLQETLESELGSV